jgi:hypothetical protein
MKKVFDSYEEAFEYAKTLPWKYTETTDFPDCCMVTYSHITIDSDEKIYYKPKDYEYCVNEILCGESLNDGVLQYLVQLHNREIRKYDTKYHT